MGYSYLGEINNQSICIKYSSIPQTGGSTAQSKLPPSVSNHNLNSFNSTNNNNSPAPPVPPRPTSFLNMNPNTSNDILSIEQTYVHVNNRPHSMSPTNQGYNTTQRAYQTQLSHVYNPLQGVPFEINPVYSTNDSVNSRENLPVSGDLFSL